MKKRLRAIACVGLAVCLVSGLWSCARDTGRVPETESGNTTVNYVYSGTYNLSNIPEEPSAGDEQTTGPAKSTAGKTQTAVEQPVQTVQSSGERPNTTLKGGIKVSEASSRHEKSSR